MKTVKFYTLGCKVNQYETQSIRERFSEKGYHETYNGDIADTYLINTCTVTAVADRKSKNIIRRCIKENPTAKIMVTGCLVEKDIVSLSRIKGIDFVIGKKFFADGISNFCGHTRAFLKIQDGCNNFCAYCKVPLVRGSSRSRPLPEIIQEANKLVKNGFTPLEIPNTNQDSSRFLTGFKEIVLCGICLGAYGRDLREPIGLVDVIEALENIEGLLRIRLSSIEAGDVSDALIDKLTQSKKLCPHLHIPMQSGDDEILRRMNRGYKAGDYLNLIKELKKVIPRVAITTDVMVGFPGEDEQSFQNTIKLIKAVLPLKTHIFPYSKREGTAAARDFRDGLSPKIMRQRIACLKNIAEDCAREYKKRFVNKKMHVLIETQPKDRLGFWQGYTDNYIRVLVESELNLENQIICVKLKKTKPLKLY